MSLHQYPDSYYTATVKGVVTYPTLTEKLRADVCVIGGGYTGLSAALNLAERGYKVILLEAERVGWGASGRNGGFAGSDQRKDQYDLEKIMGNKDAHLLWDVAEAAKDEVRSRIKKHNIDCDLKYGVLACAHKPKYVPEIRDYIEKLKNEYNCTHRRFVDQDELREMVGTTIYYGAELNTDSMHLHPLNYALGLGRAAAEAGVQIFENSRVLSYDRKAPTTIKTAQGEVVADYLILGCNGYLGNLEPRMAGKIMPINNYILATEPLGDELAKSIIRDDVGVVDTKFVVYYYRLSADKRLVFGGGENYSSKFPSDLKSFVRKHMLTVYPQLKDIKIDYAWGGALAVTVNRMPHFGRLEPNIFFAQGYSGHGLCMASLAGKLIAEAMAGTSEQFDVMARVPTHTFPGGTLLRWPGLVAGMLYYKFIDNL